MPNTKPAVALDPTPDPAELLAAKAAGLTLVAYRAMQKQEPRRTSGISELRNFAHSGIPSRMREQLTKSAVTIVLPWSALLPDNRRIGAAIASGGDRPFVGTTKEYRLAKAKAVERIREQLPDEWLPIAIPVAIQLVLVEPNRSAKRDLLNYQKLICDAMSGVVYADDSLIDDAHFTRGAPDIDRPRAEITVRPIGAPR